MKANYHTHTQRCRHALGAEEDYVLAAIQKGLSVLGFSEHAPFPDRAFDLHMLYEEMPEYLSEIDRLAEEYRSQIILHKALEIEYMPWYEDYYHALLGHWGMDYLLLGDHIYYDDRGNLFNIFQSPSSDHFVLYARCVARALETGLFPVLAHPDVFALHPYGWDRNCEEACEIILQAASDNHTVLEFNAKGLRHGLQDFPEGRRYPYPAKAFWDKVVGTGIPVIVGADAHAPENLEDDAVQLCRRLLKQLGITPLEDLEYLFPSK